MYIFAGSSVPGVSISTKIIRYRVFTDLPKTSYNAVLRWFQHGVIWMIVPGVFGEMILIDFYRQVLVGQVFRRGNRRLLLPAMRMYNNVFPPAEWELAAMFADCTKAPLLQDDTLSIFCCFGLLLGPYALVFTYGVLRLHSTDLKATVSKVHMETVASTRTQLLRRLKWPKRPSMRLWHACRCGCGRGGGYSLLHSWIALPVDHS